MVSIKIIFGFSVLVLLFLFQNCSQFSASTNRSSLNTENQTENQEGQVTLHEAFTQTNSSIKIQNIDLNNTTQLILQGEGFLTYMDSHSDSDKLVAIWDDFETGNYTNPYGTWTEFNTSNISSILNNDTNARASQNNHYHWRRKSVDPQGSGLGGLEWNTSNSQVYYFSHWVRLSSNFSMCTNTGTQQWKFVRFYSDGGSSNINIYPTISCGYSTFGFQIEFYSPQVLAHESRSDLRYSDLLGQWIRLDVKLIKSTPGHADGTLQLIANNQVVYDFKRDTGSKNTSKFGEEHGFDSATSDFADHLIVGSYASGVISDAYVDFDDIYYSNSEARVELCNAATFSNATHCELQIPTSWNNTNIKLKFNPGSFQSGQDAYLFVITEQNQTNPEGFKIIIP